MNRQYGMWNKAAYDTSGFDPSDDDLPSYDEIYAQVEEESRKEWDEEAMGEPFKLNGAAIHAEVEHRLWKLKRNL